MTTRIASVNDKTQIQTLLNQYLVETFKEPNSHIVKSLKDTTTALENPDIFFVIAEDGYGAYGFARVDVLAEGLPITRHQTNKSVAYIDLVFVVRSKRGSLYGYELLKAVEKEARERNLGSVFLHAQEGTNLFYAKHNYKATTEMGKVL